MATKTPEKGDKVSWNWGGGAPGGKVAETKDKGEIAIKSKRGNTIKKNASPDNPAVHVERSGNDVVKRASELTVEEKASDNKNKGGAQSNGKRKAKTHDAETDTTEDEAGDVEDPHTKNKQGVEVKRGGKKANKRQKKRQDEDASKGKTDNYEMSEEGEQEEKPKKVNDKRKSTVTKKALSKGQQGERKSSSKTSNAKTKKDPTQRNDGDMVSTRTRSQGKTK
ncbi:hypothetical protein F5Y19DRAFT_424074 [Xylariaceae sp. FL1651]|nr:hypothetical protein F5Y19DRAFT_424074 [Xylariaceae sp. FL1651]